MITTARKPFQVYRINRGVRYAHVVSCPRDQVEASFRAQFGASADVQAQALDAGIRVSTVFAHYSIDPAALSPCPAAARQSQAPAVDARPLWQVIADPGYYEGSDRRGTQVRGR